MKMIILAYNISILNFKSIKTLRTPALSITWTDQVNPGEKYDPLLMSLVKSTSISVDEGEETG
jgi:hypothetical protein